MVKIVNNILWDMEEQKATALTVCDLSAAFDTVYHKIHLEVLHNKFGVTGKALERFQLYLEGRKCKVNVGTSYSRDHDLNFSVPQGSCVGPVAYSAYAPTIQEAVNPSEFTANTQSIAHSESNQNHIDLHRYADDHGIKRSFIPKPLQEKTTITLLEEALVRIKTWMDLNCLKMNTTKMEFIVFRSKQQLKKVEVTNIIVNGDSIPRSEVIKFLGTWMDQYLSFRQHILKKCNVAMINLQRIKAIRRILTVEATEILVCGLVTSHLDYSNAVLYGLPKVDIQKLQQVQNCVAKLILNKHKYNSNVCALKELHWLPITLRINHKILSLTHNCIHGKAPKYLQDLLTVYKGDRQGLQSSNNGIKLKQPRTKYKTFADRSFSCAALKLWNELPQYLREITDIIQFKHQLKLIFSESFNL